MVPGALSVTARALVVRARVAAHADRGPSRDALSLDLLAGGPISRERVVTSWGDTDALRRLADAKRTPLQKELARALAEQHRRLGASPASFANLERLARGEAVATVAGQQPAALGGPLYSLHKTASTVGLAAEVTRRTGAPCVPLFWMHGEDSDFAEIRSVTVADAELQLQDFALPEGAHSDGGLVGAIALDHVRVLGEQAFAAWAGLPGEADARAHWRRALEHARDLGEVMSALWLSLFADQGLVVVDPRLPEFRAAARPILDRYLDVADGLHAAARRAGERMESLTGRRALHDASLDSFVFGMSDGHRHKVGAAEARAAGTSLTLSPSVALRPAVQDGVFPTVAMACGAGEIAYLLQLREVFEGVGIRPAAPVLRFGATWLPPAARELLEAAGCDPWELVAHTDAVVARVAEARVPETLRRSLVESRASLERMLAELSEAARPFDASLPQMVDSARGKLDFQLARLAEGVLGKARGKLDRDHPLWRRLRYVLWPGDKLQERRLASLEPIARLGPGTVAGLCEHATEHAARTAEGVHEHYLLEA